MKTVERERIEWLDIAKGIGILLVVVGHCTKMSGRVFQWIFTFHMPMFFFFSGYVFTSGRPFGTLLKKRARSLLLPFAGYFLLGLIVTLLLPVWREGLSWTGIARDLYTGSPNAAHNSSIWYLLCLFFVSLAFWAVDQAPISMQAVLVFVLYFVGMWIGKTRPSMLGYERLPLTVDVVPTALAFYALAVYARRSGVLERATARLDTSLVLFVLGGICTVLIHRDNGYVNLHEMRFGESFLYLLGGLAGTASVIGFSGAIVRLQRTSLGFVFRTLRWYGQNSLTILGTQSLMIRLYIVAVQMLWGIRLTLYQFPPQHAIISSVLVGLMICPAICALQKRAKQLWMKRRHMQ